VQALNTRTFIYFSIHYYGFFSLMNELYSLTLRVHYYVTKKNVSCLITHKEPILLLSATFFFNSRLDSIDMVTCHYNGNCYQCHLNGNRVTNVMLIVHFQPSLTL